LVCSWCSWSAVGAVRLQSSRILFGLLVKRMRPAEWAIFLKRQLIRRLTFILCGRIVSVFAALTGQCDDISHVAISPQPPDTGSEQSLSGVPAR
jgi:hypothetical protein